MKLNDMKKELKALGVNYKFYKGLKKDETEKVLDRAKRLKEIYAEHLKWENIGGEINYWLERKVGMEEGVSFDVVEERVRNHARSRPSDIGRK